MELNYNKIKKEWITDDTEDTTLKSDDIHKTLKKEFGKDFPVTIFSDGKISIDFGNDTVTAEKKLKLKQLFDSKD